MGKFHKDRNDPPDVKFWRRIETRGDCWVWLAARKGKVPTIKSGGRQISAERLSYEIQHKQQIPPKHECYKTCNTFLCVRHVAIRRIGTRPVHPNSIASVRRHCRNGALPVAKKIRVFFHPEHLSNREVSAKTGVGGSNVQRLRANRENLPTKRTAELRSIVRREGIESCVQFLCGKYPPCSACGGEMRTFDSKRSRVFCHPCGKSKQAKRGEVRLAAIRYILPDRMRAFLESVANGKPSRQAAKAARMASVTVPKIRTLLIDEFGPVVDRARSL